MAAFPEIGPELRTWLTSQLPEFAGEIYQDNVPASFERYIEQKCQAAQVIPYLWFQRVGSDRDRCLSDVGNRPDVESFAVELVGPDMGSLQESATGLHHLDGFRGLIGSIEVDGFYVDDQSDDYLVRNAADGLEVLAFDVEIIYRS